jgi:hypothetical protein
MSRCSNMIAALLLPCLVFAAWAQTKDQPGAGDDPCKVTITVVREKQTDKTLQLRCQIRNDSRSDIWMCDKMSLMAFDFETLWGPDGRTLVIRRRMDIPWGVATEQPLARYVRVPAGGDRTETLLLPLPLSSQIVVSSPGTPPAADHITRLAFEIGYYEGDLPAMIRDALAEKRLEQGSPDDELRVPAALYFNEINEYYRTTDEEILFYMDPLHSLVKEEHVARAVLENLQIPRGGQLRGLKSLPPSLKKCTRLQISFEPSAWEYYFPHADQQRLFSPAEAKYLQLPRTVRVDYWVDVKEFAYQVGETRESGIAFQGAKARVTCYDENTRLMTLDLYGDCLVAETGEAFSDFVMGYHAKFRELAPEIRPYDFRVRCADNLKDLHNRFRLYPQARKSRSLKPDAVPLDYPMQTTWCDQLSVAFGEIGMLDEFVAKPFKCPGGGEGKSHYAMNPNCRYDSPGDRVLLFETQAGWNQSGGPELFTAENHAPRGGLVLLNDGTVKFIRTKDDLRRLRWQ